MWFEARNEQQIGIYKIRCSDRVTVMQFYLGKCVDTSYELYEDLRIY